MRAPFVLQTAPTPEDVLGENPSGAADHGRPGGHWRIGFTASRKVGGAVQRNRAKRRLRAVAREVMPDRAAHGQDYVLVARLPVLTCPYSRLVADLVAALRELEGGGRRSRELSTSSS